jgi:hypothetical protein
MEGMFVTLSFWFGYTVQDITGIHVMRKVYVVMIGFLYCEQRIVL